MVMIIDYFIPSQDDLKCREFGLFILHFLCDFLLQELDDDLNVARRRNGFGEK